MYIICIKTVLLLCRLKFNDIEIVFILCAIKHASFLADNNLYIC